MFHYQRQQDKSHVGIGLNNNSNVNNNNSMKNDNRATAATQQQQQSLHYNYNNNNNSNQYNQQQLPPITTPILRPLSPSSIMHEDHQNISTLKDAIISLQYRLKTLQTQVHTKMQRQQCFSLLQRKANTNNVKKFIQQVHMKIDMQRQREQKRLVKLEEEQKKKVQELRKRLKQTNNNTGQTLHTEHSNILTQHRETKNLNNSSPKQYYSHNHNSKLIKPQQLYLQSNETMFSMLIDQINQIKHNQSLIQRLIQSKHKKTVGLNNQVCRKLDSLEKQMEEMVRYVDWIGEEVQVVCSMRGNGNSGMEKKVNINSNKISNKKRAEQQQENFLSYHSSNPNKKPLSSHSKKIVSKSEKQPLSAQYRSPQSKPINIHYQHISNNLNNNNNNLTQSQSFQSIRLQLFSKSLQTIQKQLTQKLNIKDLLPFIKQNIPNLEQPLQQMKLYIEENFQSMRKILQNQSQINQQLTKANKVAWFHCYQKFIVTGNTQRDEQEGGMLSSQSSTSRQQQHHQQSQQQQPLGYILFSQQLINLIPQNVQIDKQQQYTLRINTKGWYLVKVFIKQVKKDSWQSKDEAEEFFVWVEVNGIARYPLMMGSYRLLNLAQGSFIRVITQEDDVFVQMKRL